MILFGILFLIILSYSVNADWHSSTFGGSVTVESTSVYTWHSSSFGGSVEVTYDFPAPNITTLTPSTTQIEIHWTDDERADTTYIEYSNNNDTNWDRGKHTEVCNQSSSPFTHTSLSPSLSYYYKAWSYNETTKIWSDGSSVVDTSTLQSYTWHNASFGGSVEVLDIPINTSITPTTWIAGSSNVGTSVQENFTFYQNGSSNLDITIGINTTNFSFVDYTTYDSSGYNQICANFTTDSWSSETNIDDTSYPFSTSLQSDFAHGNFTFGVRIWMPKMLDSEDVDENFELILSSSEHT